MSLVSLGVAKNQWYHRWIEGGTLRANTQKFYRELQFVHDFLESVRGTWV
jgi:hypothetical protein